MRAHSAATSTATIAVSNIPAAPPPMLSSREGKSIAPVDNMMTVPVTIPTSSVTILKNTAITAIYTNRYGMICTRS